MKIDSRNTKLTLLALLCMTIMGGFWNVVGVSFAEEKKSALVKEGIFRYLKNGKTSLTDEHIRKIAESVYREARDYDIDYRLVLAVMKVESNFSSNAVSKRGARGLLQVKPSLAKYISEETGVTIKSPKCLEEPEKNIRIGVSHLSWLVDKFENLKTALHAYNAGLGKIKASGRNEAGPDTRFTRKVLAEYHLMKTILPDANGED